MDDPVEWAARAMMEEVKCNLGYPLSHELVRQFAKVAIQSIASAGGQIIPLVPPPDPDGTRHFRRWLVVRGLVELGPFRSETVASRNSQSGDVIVLLSGKAIVPEVSVPMDATMGRLTG